VDVSLAAAAALSGLAMGGLSGVVADRVAAPRYGVGAEGHDPDDAALAPLEPPTTRGQRAVLALVGAGAMLALAAAFEDGWRLAYFGSLLFVYLAAMTVDLQYLRLPNVFTYPAAVLAVVGALALAAHEDVPASGMWVGMVAYAGFLWVARAAYLVSRGREGMGLGDVKLALSLGASVGWLGSVGFDPGWAGALRLVVYAALLGNLVGAVVGLVVLRTVDREFPFGPSLVFGWLIVAAFFEPLTG
jgi:leader peptidase (prepilin peptidase)/N-methyltransferase